MWLPPQFPVTSLVGSLGLLAAGGARSAAAATLTQRRAAPLLQAESCCPMAWHVRAVQRGRRGRECHRHCAREAGGKAQCLGNASTMLHSKAFLNVFLGTWGADETGHQLHACCGMSRKARRVQSMSHWGMMLRLALPAGLAEDSRTCSPGESCSAALQPEEEPELRNQLAPRPCSVFFPCSPISCRTFLSPDYAVLRSFIACFLIDKTVRFLRRRLLPSFLRNPCSAIP